MSIIYVFCIICICNDACCIMTISRTLFTQELKENVKVYELDVIGEQKS